VLSTEDIANFQQVVKKHDSETKSGYAIIITQVDPDALGASFLMKELLSSYSDFMPEILYAGSISHPQNRAIVNKYDLKTRMRPITEIDAEFLSKRKHVLVDSCLSKDGRLPRDLEINPVIVVDHHRGCDVPSTDDNFIWIEDIGSASTMMIELAQACWEDGIVDAFYDEHKWLATMLALGIYTDTGELTSATSRDRKAHEFVCEYLHESDLRQLINYPLPDSHYKHLAKALANVEEKGPYLIAGVGYMDPKDGDDLSTIADFFLRKNGISLVVVWGIIDGSVRISARNNDLSNSLDDFIKERFTFGGAKLAPDGRGEGGAMLKLDLGFWLAEETKEAVEKMVTERLRSCVIPPEDKGTTRITVSAP
jgi:nanoRNase/pAp phosphatase (c-di-AMP/oligoRNAs hydrolase)